MKGSKRKLESKKIKKNQARFPVSCCHEADEMQAKRDYRKFDNKVCLKTRVYKKHKSLIGKTDGKSCRENSHPSIARTHTVHMHLAP